MTTEEEIRVMQPEAEERQQPPEARETRDRFPTRTSEGSMALLHLHCGPVIQILDFLPPELCKNKFLLFSATKCVAVGYSSPRKLIHQVTPMKSIA